jgi:hypothetical protein
MRVTVAFPEAPVASIMPTYPPIKDRVIYGPTETAATLTNQAQNNTIPTLSIVPPPPTAKAAMSADNFPVISRPDVSTAQLPESLPLPAASAASAAGFPWVVGGVLALLAFGMFAKKKKVA